MQKSDLITAALLAALVPGAACNSATSDRNMSESRGVIGEADERPVATSGTLPVWQVPDDAAVTSRIQAKFFLDPVIKQRRIDVDSEAGVVTLRGDVASDNERAQALLLARTTDGVERVEDALSVNAAIGAPPSETAVVTPSEAPAPSNADDEELTSRLQAKFGEDQSLTSATISVTAKDGVVLLDGLVPTASAKRRAIAVARATEGVVQVIDRLQMGR